MYKLNIPFIAKCIKKNPKQIIHIAQGLNEGKRRRRRRLKSYTTLVRGAGFCPSVTETRVQMQTPASLLIQYWHGSNSYCNETRWRSNQARQKLHGGQALSSAAASARPTFVRQQTPLSLSLYINLRCLTTPG